MTGAWAERVAPGGRSERPHAKRGVDSTAAAAAAVGRRLGGGHRRRCESKKGRHPAAPLRLPPEGGRYSLITIDEKFGSVVTSKFVNGSRIQSLR